MSRQFILIDHSIENSAGHYLEYARHVLGAAKADGFRTVLAINQCAQSIECPEADLILKTFSKTFWENQTYSKIGLLNGFVLKKSSRAIRPAYANKFAEELADLISKASVDASDLVFIPTLGGTELMGVSLYSASSEAVPLSWHMLFRRDVLNPKNWFDLRGHVLKWKVKASFTTANAAFRRGIRYFYTDTEELTQQYRSLEVGEFKTLPIPIDPRLGYKRPWHEGPLVVSYLGDMRAEKGIHLLPRIIQSLRDDGFDASRVVFRIQGNLPNREVTRSTLRVKDVLASKKICGVEVVEGPLNSAAYHELLIGSDVLLLPYSISNYAVRSSGLFAEAIAAGIPTIHPRDSWMGRNAVSLSRSGYIKITQITVELKALLQDYKKHETVSLEFSKKWRSKHSAQKLIQILDTYSQVKNTRFYEENESPVNHI